MKVSAFKNVYDKIPQTVDLYRWLAGHDSFDKVVKKLRAEKDPDKRKTLKLSLPCMIPAGMFSDPNDSSLIHFSGLMSFDFDSVDNPQEMKKQIMKNRFVFYCGLSTGGNGLFALVAVAHNAIGRWKEYYDAVVSSFGPATKYVDLKCSNISRKRFYSYDPDGFFNEEVLKLPLLLKPAENNGYGSLDQNNNFFKGKDYSGEVSDDQNKIELLIKRIEETKADITSDYNQWICIGAALANNFGEYGRSYFHKISQFYPQYNPKQVDYQYSKSLKSPPNFGLAMIFDISKKNNLLIKE